MRSGPRPPEAPASHNKLQDMSRSVPAGRAPSQFVDGITGPPETFSNKPIAE